MPDVTPKPRQDTPKPTTLRTEPGSYDHNDTHNFHYSKNGVSSHDNEIDRAWARLHDKGVYAGPAMSEPFTSPDNPDIEMQHFLYAHASRDTRDTNVNKHVVFTFGPHDKHIESGL